ncbi:phage tail sheath family protein [Chryseobacterium sp. CFBP8996]|uniref:phage tail sheath family protein n=1 Tax=Chryseobacterium sp. CFBP8996 TaxID=3096529 RepID=UPI002A6A34B9|nr:phage tail sheath C-terminal domain-containing protein [Chryseobacterium sp. CFBP8996]MDY0933101.1 phage tail sheath C-terminal domain-containing protein [Chryseobacterium sp. CFBP8996]
MSNPTTPGVSVEEITKLPYSIALIDTAIPVFIGYTDQIPEGYDINDVNNKKLKISSLLEYEDKFGKAKLESIQLKDTKDKGLTVVAPEVQFLMYYSLQMYFANGGGPCYIISVGTYASASTGVQLSSLINGLDKVDTLKAIKDPILLVFPDAVSLTEPSFYELYNYTIGELETKKRFAILDTYEGNSTTIGNFRAGVSSTNHAAAYFPHLKTILNYSFDEDKTITHAGLQEEGQESDDLYAGEIAAIKVLRDLASVEISNESVNGFVLADLLSQAIAITEEIYENADSKDALKEAINDSKDVVDAIYGGIIDDFKIPEDLKVDTPIFRGEFDDLIDAIRLSIDKVGNANGLTLKNLQASDSLLYNQIKEAIRSLQVVLPPSSAIAGVYGRVDSIRGVWKAPANVSLSYVTEPTEKVSEKEQSDLNIHNSGKSINAVRTFTGKGNLIWGARTLDGKDKKSDGKDNEWKYIHVRRYYDMIQQSISKALERFIDEPNTSHTWLRAKTMLENFLNQQWMEGALAGSTPKEAYEVKVYGTEDPVTHNITNPMNIEIKIALVRPAEFIILNFSHKLQQS